MAQRERERMILWRILLHFSDIALERCLWVRNIISNVEHFGDFTLQLIFFDILYKLQNGPFPPFSSRNREYYFYERRKRRGGQKYRAAIRQMLANIYQFRPTVPRNRRKSAAFSTHCLSSRAAPIFLFDMYEQFSRQRGKFVEPGLSQVVATLR